MIKMRQITYVSSHYNVQTGMTTVTLDVGRENADGALIREHTVTGEAEWNTKSDPHSFAECFKIAYERALAKTPKENIIEKCGGLKDGDWVCTQDKGNNTVEWGMVFNNNILYVIGKSGNYDKVSTFSNGESEFDRITTIVRPIDSYHPITCDIIHLGLYKTRYRDHYEIYTA